MRKKYKTKTNNPKKKCNAQLTNYNIVNVIYITCNVTCTACLSQHVYLSLSFSIILCETIFSNSVKSTS